MDVLVVGAVNVDLVAAVEQRPGAGQTVFASRLERRSGGKGANQAAAAVRAGARTALISAVGDDPDGVDQLADLRASGVDVATVRVDPGHPTGIALITVTPDAENAIVVVAGAAQQLSPAQVAAACAAVGTCRVVVGQTEVPAAAVDEAGRCCGRLGARFVLNSAPVAVLAQDTLQRADPLVVNEHEARQLLEAPGIADAALATALRVRTGARSVVVTLGRRGIVADGDGAVLRVPADPVEALDSTGAGDAFVGTLAAVLASGGDLEKAVRAANAAGAQAVSWPGARPPR